MEFLSDNSLDFSTISLSDRTHHVNLSEGIPKPHKHQAMAIWLNPKALIYNHMPGPFPVISFGSISHADANNSNHIYQQILHLEHDWFDQYLNSYQHLGAVQQSQVHTIGLIGSSGMLPTRVWGK